MNQEKPSNVRVIVGLGNPGNKYSKTRHSIGFRVVDELASQCGGTWQPSDLMERAEINIDNKNILLIKPLTFMNSSGKIMPYLSKKGIKPEEILVVHDELEKKFGHISVRLGGSHKGHNGLRSIIEVIGKEFWRLRFGIGRPEDKAEVSDYVLSNFTPAEEANVPSLIEKSLTLILDQ